MVRESFGGMFDGGVCVVVCGTGISVYTVSYRTLTIFCLTLLGVEPMTNLYGFLFGRVPHCTCLLAFICTLGVLYWMLMGGIGVCTFSYMRYCTGGTERFGSGPGTVGRRGCGGFIVWR